MVVDPGDPNPQHARRVFAIDFMRACALTGMVFDHFQLYFGNDAASGTWPYFLAEHALGDWGAAAFLLMTGMSQVLSNEKWEAYGNRLLFKRAALRGTYLFGAGLLMLVLTWGPSQLWQWDILTLMGFSTAVLFACRFLPSWAILLSGAVMAVTAPLLRGASGFLAYWGGALRGVPVISDAVPGFYVEPVAKYQVVWAVKPVILGFLVNGYFPLFPWLLVPLIGFILGRRIVSGKAPSDIPRLFALGLTLAAAALTLGLAASRTAPPEAAVSGFLAPFSFSPDSFTMFIFQNGMVLVCYSSLYYLFDVRRKDKPESGPLARLIGLTSRFSLSFYVLHYLFIGWTLFAVYLATGKYRISSLMNDTPALLCGLAAFVLLEVLLYFWQKAEGKYSLEWFLGVLTVKFASPPESLDMIPLARVTRESSSPP